MSVFTLARQPIRARKVTFAAAFVAVFAGSALITTSGVLFDSGLRAGIPPQRYADAAVVVTADQIASTEDGITQRFAERGPLPVARADDIARVPGVASVVPDVGISFSLTRTAQPTVPPLPYAGILAAAALVGWGAIAIPTRFALRPAAVAAMRVGD
jgi:putative ABC transport system permease protein